MAIELLRKMMFYKYHRFVQEKNKHDDTPNKFDIDISRKKNDWLGACLLS